jgi:hypothetical protein
VSLTQQYRGHPAAACLDDEPQHVPDVAVCRVHAITAEHLVLAGQLVRDGVDGHGLRDRPWATWRARRSRHHAARRSVVGPQVIRFPAADGVLVVLITREVRRLGGIQPLELGRGAAQPDLVLGGAGSPGVDEAGVDEAERDNFTGPLPVRPLNHQVGDRVAAADDQGPELAAVAVRAANLSLEPEQLCLRHAVLPRCHRQP